MNNTAEKIVPFDGPLPKVRRVFYRRGSLPVGARLIDGRHQDESLCHTYVVRRDGSVCNLTKRIRQWERGYETRRRKRATMLPKDVMQEVGL